MAKGETLGYKIVMDILCKEVLSSCPINNEKIINQRARHHKISNGKLFIKLGWEIYNRIRFTLTRKQRENAFYELSKTSSQIDRNKFYKAGARKGGLTRQAASRSYKPGVTFPLDIKPVIQKAARDAGLSVVAFIRQAVHRELDIELNSFNNRGQHDTSNKKPTQAEREDITTVDTVLPIKDLTEV